MVFCLISNETYYITSTERDLVSCNNFNAIFHCDFPRWDFYFTWLLKNPKWLIQLKNFKRWRYSFKEEKTILAFPFSPYKLYHHVRMQRFLRIRENYNLSFNSEIDIFSRKPSCWISYHNPFSRFFFSLPLLNAKKKSMKIQKDNNR